MDWKPDSGDTAWLLVCTGLVMLMTPGLSLYYGGMVRRKNVLASLMQSWMLMAVVSVAWAVLGYSLAFSPKNPFIGGLSWAFLPWKEFSGRTPLGYADSVPHLAFMSYHMMFPVLATAVIFGSVAERLRFKAMVAFGLLWSLLVYAPLAHMVWGYGGFLHGVFQNGKPYDQTGVYPALDFAGGTVVHVSSGIAALVACLLVGKRVNYEREPMPPHSMVLSTVGAALLWFGWFGSNGGKAMSSGMLAASAITSTQLAAAAATLSWILVEWRHRGHPSVLGAITGAVAGLVVITPAAGYVEPFNAVWMGAIGGAVCYLSVAIIKAKLRYDDSLDAFGVHGVGGVVGVILTGIFANATINPAGADGLFRNNPVQLVNQTIAVLVTVSYSGIVSFVLLKLVDRFVGLRVNRDEELEGLDLTQHREVGYNM